MPITKKKVIYSTGSTSSKSSAKVTQTPERVISVESKSVAQPESIAPSNTSTTTTSDIAVTINNQTEVPGHETEEKNEKSTAGVEDVVVTSNPLQQQGGGRRVSTKPMVPMEVAMKRTSQTSLPNKTTPPRNAKGDNKTSIFIAHPGTSSGSTTANVDDSHSGSNAASKKPSSVELKPESLSRSILRRCLLIGSLAPMIMNTFIQLFTIFKLLQEFSPKTLNGSTSALIQFHHHDLPRQVDPFFFTELDLSNYPTITSNVTLSCDRNLHKIKSVNLLCWEYLEPVTSLYALFSVFFSILVLQRIVATISYDAKDLRYYISIDNTNNSLITRYTGYCILLLSITIVIYVLIVSVPYVETNYSEAYALQNSFLFIIFNVLSIAENLSSSFNKSVKLNMKTDFPHPIPIRFLESELSWKNAFGLLISPSYVFNELQLQGLRGKQNLASRGDMEQLSSALEFLFKYVPGAQLDLTAIQSEEGSMMPPSLIHPDSASQISSNQRGCRSFTTSLIRRLESVMGMLLAVLNTYTEVYSMGLWSMTRTDDVTQRDPRYYDNMFNIRLFDKNRNGQIVFNPKATYNNYCLSGPVRVIEILCIQDEPFVPEAALYAVVFFYSIFIIRVIPLLKFDTLDLRFYIAIDNVNNYLFNKVVTWVLILLSMSIVVFTFAHDTAFDPEWNTNTRLLMCKSIVFFLLNLLIMQNYFHSSFRTRKPLDVAQMYKQRIPISMLPTEESSLSMLYGGAVTPDYLFNSIKMDLLTNNESQLGQRGDVIQLRAIYTMLFPPLTDFEAKNGIIGDE